LTTDHVPPQAQLIDVGAEEPGALVMPVEKG
jgi:hypothetical protein